VREVGAIDNSAYRQLNDVTTLHASKGLRELRDIGLLDQKKAVERPTMFPLIT